MIAAQSTHNPPPNTASQDDTPRTIPCHEPATGTSLGEVTVDSPDEVRAIIARARRAQPELARLSFSKRRALLRAILDQVVQNADELCEWVVRDSGKTRENAMLGEIWPIAEKLRWTIAHGEKHLRSERRSPGPLVHKRARVEFHPLGVVGVICPWNYPLQNILGPVIPALMAGNACVVKVSEWVAWSSLRFQRLLDDALRSVGLPTDLVRIINGYAATGAALVSGGVDAVVFTGSVENGRRVLAESAETVTPVILELGGKDPMIVCADADLDQALHAAMAGVYIAAGQNCMAAERIIVHADIYDRFVERFVPMVRALRQGPPLGGDPVDVGAIVSPLQLDQITKLVDKAIAQGARALVGGRRALEDVGQYFAPTVLTGVTEEMDIMREETFGPVAVICKVDSDAEAIRLANSTSFGLSATVLSRNARHARRIADQIVAGSTNINDFGLAYMAQALPFGGAKVSGFGRLNGREGLRAMSNQKAVLDDRLPLHQPAKIYPVAGGDYELARGTIRMLYGPGLRARMQGAADLASGLRRRLGR